MDYGLISCLHYNLVIIGWNKTQIYKRPKANFFVETIQD